MYIATCIMQLGYTRTNGVIAYNQSDKSFPLLTPARAKKMIDAGELKGVLWEKNEETGQLEFIPDKEGFNLENIMVLSGLTYRPWHETVGETIQNSIYSVVRVIEDDDRTLYEVVSNTFQRICLSDVQLVGLNEITTVGGINIDKNGDIRVLDGVIIEKKSTLSDTYDASSSTEKKARISRRVGDSEDKPSNTKRKQHTRKK